MFSITNTKVIPVHIVGDGQDQNRAEDENLDPEEEKESGDCKDALRVSMLGNAKAFADGMSIVGMSYVVKENTAIFRRLIWLTLIVGGMVFMGYQVRNRIMYYLSNPTMVEISSTYKDEMRFPTVTICNENMASRDQVWIPGMIELFQELYPNLGSFSDVNQLKAINVTRLYAEYSYAIFAYDPYYEQMWLDLSPFEDKSDAIRGLIWAYFNGDRIQEDFANLFPLVPTDMGYCMQFNGGEFGYPTGMTGSNYGLKLVINTSQSNYLINRSVGAGFRVMLHHPDETPLMENDGLKIGVGQITSVSAKLQTIENLPAPYGNCSDARKYKYKECLFECQNHFVIEECGCKFFYYQGNPNTSVCNPVEEVTCGRLKFFEFITIRADADICNCPPQCKNDFYQYTVSTQPISTYLLRSIYLDNWALVMAAKEDIAILEIYFEELLHESIKMMPDYTILSLLCDIGGAMGLVLGATVLTVVEALDFGIDMLYQFIKYHTMAKDKLRQKLSRK